MTTFNWKDESTEFIRGCLCGDKNNCAGCPTWEEHKGSIYPKPLTHYDCLISKTPEEMAEWINNNSCLCAPGKEPCEDGECEECWLDWLRQEAEE